MKFLAFCLVVFTAKLGRAVLSPQCQSEVQIAADCALGPIQECFQQSGCEFPDGPPPPPQGQGSSPNERCACVQNLIARAKPSLHGCMREEFPRIPQKFFDMMEHTMQRFANRACKSDSASGQGQSQRRDEMRAHMQEIIYESCRGDQYAADQVHQCLEDQKQGGQGRIRSCLRDNLSEDCQGEVMQSVCTCMNELMDNDPTILEDGLQCMGDKLPAIARNPQMIRNMLRNFCQNPNGMKNLMNIVQRMRGLRNQGQRGGFGSQRRGLFGN